MKDPKNTLSNIAAYAIALGTFLAGLNVTVLHLPVWVTALGGAIVGLGGFLNALCTGRNSDLSKKTTGQLENQLEEAANTKEVKP